MLKVFKYPIGEFQEVVDLPSGAQILDVQEQRGTFCLWALVDPDEDQVTKRKLFFVGTGHPIERDVRELAHIATLQLHGGSLVIHVFEQGVEAARPFRVERQLT